MTLIDTDILIDSGRAVPEAVRLLADLRSRSVLSISVVTRMELMVGCRDKTELAKLDQFLQGFQILPLDAAISAKAVELLHTYRLSHGLLIADSFIAATAITLDLPLVTKNQGDYRFMAGLKLIPYP